jgi:membrane-bound lytic murein transglycosylase D
MNSLKCLCLCFFLCASGIINSVQSQSVPVSNPVTDTKLVNDPIIELLDSLVMLNNIIRFNSISNNETGITSIKDVPNYSDEIYEQRIGKIYSPIPLVYNEEVKKYIDLYAFKRRGLTSRVMGLSELYFPLFEEILDKEGLPMEFKYLSIVESALNPIAVSKMGATGLWQFMYNTGKMYNLKIDSYYDERMDPIKATHAACRYFKNMYDIYGDWLLVIAAYNCGPGNVNKAIRRSGGKTNFWEIAKFLPAETRGYVPAFIAVTYVMNYASEHQIFPVQPAYNYFEVDTLAVDKSVSLKKISAAVNFPLDVIK